LYTFQPQPCQNRHRGPQTTLPGSSNHLFMHN
jgi:hypothetical protein